MPGAPGRVPLRRVKNVVGRVHPPEKAKKAARSAGHWAGYGWFMSFGTILPLLIFLGGYAVHLTLVGAPLARKIYGLGIWTSTLGQDPPGKDAIDARKAASGKKPLFERVRPYSPPGPARAPRPAGAVRLARDLVPAPRLVARDRVGGALVEPLPAPVSTLRHGREPAQRGAERDDARLAG